MMKAIKRILLVDSEKEFADTVTRHLKRNNFIMQSTTSGLEAREKIHRTTCPVSQYDLVITDVIIPTVSGIELLKWIKKYHSRISVLIVSGLGSQNMITGALRPEMDDCCQKPVTPHEMMRLIDSINKKRQTHAVHQRQNQPGHG
jgi:DNA-binding response OmpR family regulator